MNRIVIVGNGFDLGHRLLTGYNHFIDHLKVEFMNLVNDRNYIGVLNHKLFRFEPIERINYDSVNNMYLMIEADKKFTNWNELIRIKEAYYDFQIGYKSMQLIRSSSIVYKNKFLGYVFNQALTDSWGGFEEDYKNVLIAILQDRVKELDENFRIYSVRHLNNDLAQIIDLLYNYLKNINPIEKASPEIVGRLYAPPLLNWKQHNDFNDILGTVPDGKDEDFTKTLKHVLFLSFNYTKTIQNYLIKNLQKDNLEHAIPFDISDENTQSSLRYIHGDLEYGGRSSMIFGYGDELNQLQSDLEMQKDDFLKHMKSVLYTRSPSYREVIDYADADKFDIIIYGHSCSNTDRTLLNTLFEHKNCVSIQPFLHNVNDTSIYFNIYRCFKNKQLMRSRVVDETNTVRDGV
ncbi:AbiH family protein [Dyadobacter sediminis]|uniref:Bacteriophage abortive infection AbiH n=1 Tax=Dyadobacter sediminis TaxID=1493691 RepID=A0A5R9KAZ9_9BACT|nr:AbiH family protein [Dyadobacter sediminis]TLU91976.1 hypothetical protein FEM55_14540 [Dyadobacter sediminis]GGB98583.1 hypothetical protein GCM10011325_27290 [Dyadobacter sediminis]